MNIQLALSVVDRRDNPSTTLAELGLMGHRSGGLLASDAVVVNLMASELRLLCLRMPPVLLLTPSSTLSITIKGMENPHRLEAQPLLFPFSVKCNFSVMKIPKECLLNVYKNIKTDVMTPFYTISL